MTPAEIEQFLEDNSSIAQLLQMCKKQFDIIDQWQMEFENGDLLGEYELSNAMDKLTAVYMKFYPIGEIADTTKTNAELSYKEAYFNECEKEGKKPNVSEVNERASATERVKELRRIRNIFNAYSIACEKAIGTCQSRLKRLTNEKGFKGVDNTNG